MDDAALVRRFERFGDLRGDPEGVADRKRPARDALGERLAVDQLHDEEVARRVLLHAIEGAMCG